MKAYKYGRYLAVLYVSSNDVEDDWSSDKISMKPTSINARMIYEGHAKERYW